MLVFFFFKKQKDKKVTVSYKHRVLSFKTLKKKNLSRPRGLNIRSQLDQAHVASGQVHGCFVAQRASKPPASRM